MKFSKVSHLVLVSALGLAVASLVSGCLIVTIDYVFVACSSSITGSTGGQIQAYSVDAGSGALRSAGTPAVASGGSNPVALVATADYANLYVANQGNGSVVHFAIASDGSLTQKDSVTLGFTPTALAVNAAATYLYVVGATNCQVVAGSPICLIAGGSNPGKLAAYPLSLGTIGSVSSSISLTLSGYPADLVAPTSVNVLANNDAVYVGAWDQSAYNPGGTVTSSANPGWVYGFSVGSNGALTPTTSSPYQAGVKPTAIISDPTNRFVYVTDYASNEMIGYTIQSSNVLNFLVNGPFKTGSQPTAATIDPRGLFVYVTNSLSSTVSAYAIALPTGTPSAVSAASGTGASTTDTDPVAVLVEPGLGRYVYTANYLGNSISGFLLDPSAGGLSSTQATPYPTAANPTAIAAVPHGNHNVQSVTP